MTLTEARIIMILKGHFKCPDAKLAGLANAIWGEGHSQHLANDTAARFDKLGAALLRRAETFMDLKQGDLNRMQVEELACLKCNKTHWSAHHAVDTGKECPHCHEMACINPARDDL